MMTNLCFNSVPMELITDSTGESKLTPKERVDILIEQLRKFGVQEKLLFTAEGRPHPLGVDLEIT